MREPLSTYRLQISSSFTLDAAAELIDYLADLGADWVYLSPILEAEPDHSVAASVAALSESGVPATPTSGSGRRRG